MVAEPRAVLKSMSRLRDDALDRREFHAALVYGWSALRIGDEILGTHSYDLMRAVVDRDQKRLANG